MIYEYEACVLRHINKAIPSIKLATYSKEPDMFGSLSKIKETPAFLYFREVVDWEFPHTHKFLDMELKKYARFNPFMQTYTGRIYVLSNADAFDIANRLRFYWNENSYVNVPWNKDFVRVALRLLYIKIEQDRSVTDHKGPMYFVQFSWSSRLFMDNIDADQTNAIVEEIKIYLDLDGVKVLNGSNLISIVK